MKSSLEQLLEAMTLEEKITLLAGKDFWHIPGIKRLGIPALKVTDGPHGARTLTDSKPSRTLPATCFPAGVAMAATWNPELIEEVGKALGKEVRDRGCSVILGPCVNIHRSPLGGRNFESFSEDPYLSSIMTVVYIRGVQSQGIGACVKHFALNNSEYQRFTISSEADERTQREIYFPSFEKAVKEARTWAVMCSYNKVNGIHASENAYLLSEVLKKEWGFEGPVISDWFATHSTVEAANAGLDLEMPGPPLFFGESLRKAVEKGEVKEETINDKVRRVLGLVRKAGTSGNLERPVVKSFNIFEHRELCRRVAEEAIVLLKNEGQTLPLDIKKIRTLAVIGQSAAKPGIEGGGSSMVKPYYVISPLESLRRRAAGVKVLYQPGCISHRITPVLNSRYLFTEKGSQIHGLTGEYFKNNHFSGEPILTRKDKKFFLQWINNRPPVKKIGTGGFSVRWTGVFAPPRTGKYQFGLLTDGEANLYLNNHLVVNQREGEISSEPGPWDEKVKRMFLEAGKTYDIRIEYRSPSRLPFFRQIRIGCKLPVPPDLQEKAVRTAARADVALVFVGLNHEYESEGFDRTGLDLPDEQVKLIQAVSEVNPRTIVVLFNGSPVSLKDWIKDVPAVIEARYPGQEGGNAVASALLGEINPSGRLPDTFPARLEDNPAYPNYPGSRGKVVYEEGIFTGYRYYDARNIEPSFPFGFGLSYTTFEYSNLKLSPLEIKAGERLNIQVDITNTGQREGSEVVQLYVSDKEAGLPRPPKELKGFQKVRLEPGEKKTLTFFLDTGDLSFYHPGLKRWTAEPGEFEIQLGSSSRDIRLKKGFLLK